MRLKIFQLSVVALAAFVVGCNKPNNYSNNTSEVIRDFHVNVSTLNQNHPIASQTTSAVMNFFIYADNSLQYQLYLDSLTTAGDDFVKGVDVLYGDPLADNGALIATFPGKFRARSAEGSVLSIRQSLIDTLLNDNIPKYINIRTAKEPQGLVRGQINADIVYTNNTALNGQLLTPAVATPTTGMAMIRITSNKLLYSNVTIFNDEPSDPITGTTLNIGSVLQSGAPFFTLSSGAAQVQVPRVQVIPQNIYDYMLAGTFSIKAISPARPTGKIGGQVR